MRTPLLTPPGRALLVAVLSLALLAASLVALPPTPAAAAAPVSGALSLGGNLGGQVDERTAQLSVSVPLVNVQGEGGVSMSVSLSWQQARAAAGQDRAGWGAGWTIGSSYVDVGGTKTVYPASGGSFATDDTEPSGLRNYKLRDLRFVQRSGSLPARTGAGAVAYGYTLTYDDGRVDYFDANGNLAARLDRFGNRIDLTWSGGPNRIWQPRAIIDSSGLATTFDYSDPSRVVVRSPRRTDGAVPTTTVFLPTSGPRGVSGITDPAGQHTAFGYTSVGKWRLVNTITSPTGARTEMAYRTFGPNAAYVMVTTVGVKDASGDQVSPTRTFNLNPTTDRHNPTGNNGHNYIGVPEYTSPDALFASGNPNYRYSTSVTTGQTTTLSTYDALNRLIGRSISVVSAVGQPAVLAQDHAYTYPAAVQRPSQLPANYGQPSGTSVAYSAATSSSGLKASRPRTTTTATRYDDHGRVVLLTEETGATTLTRYDDRFGVVSGLTTTGADGWQKVTVNTLTDDGRNVLTSTVSEAAKGATPTARTTTSYAYDDAGRIALRTLSWAAGTDPDGDGGPDQVVTKFDRALDLAAGTEAITTTTAHGTDAANATTATVDLASGQVTASADALGRVSSFSYDAIGRPTRTSTPGGLVTSTSYTPLQTTVTTPEGRITRTTTDVLGRTRSVTDNVKNGAFVADPGARALSTVDYSADGSTVSTVDQAGQTNTSTFDAFGRTVRKVGSTGITNFTSYDDGAAHNQVASVNAEGSSQAHSTQVARYDNANREISSRTTYPTASSGSGGRPGVFVSDPVSATAFDGLGKTVSTTAHDLTVSLDRSGPGGTVVGSTVTPKAPVAFPGPATAAVTQQTLTGDLTARTLRRGGETSAAVTVVRDAAGQVRTATDPGGRTTTYTYAADGQPLTRTSPSGILTEYGYDETSGLVASVSVTAPGQAKQTTSYTRVAAGRPGAGQLETVTDASGTMTYGYDADGHRTSVRYPDGTSTAARYLDTGQLDTTTDVTGAVTSYTYDAVDGTLRTATQRRGTAVLASLSYDYDGLGRISTITRGNGVVTTNTFSNTNMLATQTTRKADQTLLAAHSYTYDAHRNPVTQTDTYPAGGSAAVPGGGSTWTTTYSYDAYDRLTGSAVYAGSLVNGKPVGQPTTATTYEIDLAGNVASSVVTTRTGGASPTTTTETSTNSIDDSDRLNAQTVGTTTRPQRFDDDGRVTLSLDGVATTYHPEGAPATVTTEDGTSTSYALWPDGSRRSATTTRGDGSTSTVAFHYGVDGVLVNDSTTDPSTGAGTASTASYLLTSSREARTLLAGTAASGSVSGSPAAPSTTGAGVGYYLRDRHTSVTGLVDSVATVTGSYAYSDYGAPARADGSSVTPTTPDGGRTNPYTFLGGMTKAPWTEASTGLLTFADRTYDADQGRFTSPDTVDAHNRYQAFNTNPIAYADLDGGISTLDIVLDCVFAVMFAVATVLTGGAALGAVGAVAAAEAGAEITAGVVANVVSTVVGTAANAVGFVTSAVLAEDDVVTVATGQGFLDDSTRATFQLVNTVAGAFATGTGIVQGLSDGAITALKETNEIAEAAQVASETKLTAKSIKISELDLPADGSTADGDTTGDDAANAPADGSDPTKQGKQKMTKVADLNETKTPANKLVPQPDSFGTPENDLYTFPRPDKNLSLLDRLLLSQNPKVLAALKTAVGGGDTVGTAENLLSRNRNTVRTPPENDPYHSRSSRTAKEQVDRGTNVDTPDNFTDSNVIVIERE